VCAINWRFSDAHSHAMHAEFTQDGDGAARFLCAARLISQRFMMWGSRSDEQLARQAQSGDRDAFLALYERYLQRVTNRVRAKVPGQDVEDVTQDVFVALVRSLDHYEQRSRFNTWVYTIVNRQIADFYRRRQRKEAPAEPVDLDSVLEHTALAGEDEGVDDRALMRQALDGLPEHYREVILLRFADGLSFQEIAIERGQTLEAVKSLHRRALQTLREQMDAV
jgi:RNA polymerase sigma-70 factor (ECF subfamily)